MTVFTANVIFSGAVRFPVYHITKVKTVKVHCYWSVHCEFALVQEGYTLDANGTIST